MIKKSIFTVLIALVAVANAHAVVALQEPPVSVPDIEVTAVLIALGAIGIFAARSHFSSRP